MQMYDFSEIHQALSVHQIAYELNKLLFTSATRMKQNFSNRMLYCICLISRNEIASGH